MNKILNAKLTTWALLVCPHCESALELEDENQIEILKEMAELINGFDEEEITEKEIQNKYEMLVEKLNKGIKWLNLIKLFLWQSSVINYFLHRIMTLYTEMT